MHRHSSDAVITIGYGEDSIVHELGQAVAADELPIKRSQSQALFDMGWRARMRLRNGLASAYAVFFPTCVRQA